MKYKFLQCDWISIVINSCPKLSRCSLDCLESTHHRLTESCGKHCNMPCFYTFLRSVLVFAIPLVDVVGAEIHASALKPSRPGLHAWRQSTCFGVLDTRLLCSVLAVSNARAAESDQTVISPGLIIYFTPLAFKPLMICVGLTAAHYSGLVFIFIDCEDRGPSQLISSWALKLCFDSF